jgi:SMI1-KNR4 cell-wall
VADVFDRLVVIAPPPVDPVTSRGDWSVAEARAGVSLPADYRRLIGLYGCGIFGGEVWLCSPFAANPNIELVEDGRDLLNGDRDVRQLDPEDFPYPLFPEPGGLLPWGRTHGGDNLYWRTGPGPDEWTVVANGSRSADFAEFPGGVAAFLLAWIEGMWSPDVLPAPGRPGFDRFPDAGESGYGSR